MKYDAIVVANGKAKRSKLGYNKVFYLMKNKKTVLENACRVFIEDKDCRNIIIVSDTKDKVFKSLKVKVVDGGKTRFESVACGLEQVNSQYVFIHDAARPFLKKEDNDKLKKQIIKNDGVILVSEIFNTVKYVENGIIKKTLDRQMLFNALTPQAFNTELLKKAYKKAKNKTFTDDSSVFENAHYKVKAVIGDSSNIKLTKKTDFENI